MGKSNIEWLNGGKTWNPIRARNRETGKRGWYCQKVSKLCARCYAERMNVNTYFGNGVPYAVDKLHQVELYLDEAVLEEPLHWKKPSMVFPCSMTDLFGEFVPFEWIEKIYTVMAATSHTYQILTKRAQRRLEFYQRHPFGTGLTALQHSNIWEGSSVGLQSEADRDIPVLLRTPAALRWLSCEPLLERVNIRPYLPILMYASMGDGGDMGRNPVIDWVVTGGESGPEAQPMHPSWPQYLQVQCEAARVPFFFKQWGEWAPTSPVEKQKSIICPKCAKYGDCLLEWVEAHKRDCDGTPQVMYRVGKKVAGRYLDGQEWNEYPEFSQV